MIERAEIRSFCNALAKRFRPRKIILFGSYAYGKPTEDSDVDLLVVMNRTCHHGERMSLRIRKAMPASFPMDIIVRTPNFISRRIAWGDPFMREIFAKGKVLYETIDA